MNFNTFKTIRSEVRNGRFSKQLLTLLLAFFIGQTIYAQKDLSIDLLNYGEGEVSTNDTLKFEFVIKNLGAVTYAAGSTLYGNIEINGIVLSFDLLGFAPSPILLPTELKPGESQTFNYGFLLASQTIPFIPGATDSLGICLILWGDDLANIANFSGDTNPADNKTCFSYLTPRPNLSIDMVNYAEGAIITTDTIKPVFEIKNLGNVTYQAGDTLYMNALLNGNLFSLNLFGSDPTPVPLPSELAPGDSITFDPGYLLGPLVLPFFPGADAVDICLIVWGDDFEHLDSYSGDVDSTNNITCVTYADPLPDLGIDMVHYTEGEISSNDTLKFEFTIKNQGNVTYPAGSTLYGNLEINGIVLAFDLLGFAPSPILLPNELKPGESLTFNYGILSASQTIPFIPGATDSLGICLILWGDDLANTANFSGDINTADNKTCFSYKAELPDLSIDMVHYTEAEVTSNDTLKFEFTIKNLGNVSYPEGTTLYGNVIFNGFVFALDLLGSAPSPIVLPSSLQPGESMTFNYGILLASQTIPFIPGASDSLGVCLVLWGDDLNDLVNYGGDINPTDNTTCFSYDKTTSAVHDLSKANEARLSIYPNPANGFASIEMSKGSNIVNIVLEDVNGRILKTTNCNTNTYRLDVSSLKNGMYFVKTRLENQKVLVERLLIHR